MIGWMNNWKYGQDIPTSPWRSCMSLVRELSLVEEGRGYAVRQAPAREYSTLRGPAMAALHGVRLGAEALSLALGGQRGLACEIDAAIHAGSAANVGLRIGSGSQAAVLTYAATTGTLSLSRPAGDCAAPGFAGTHGAGISTNDGAITLRVFVDCSTVEVFAQGGLVTLSDQIFPRASSEPVELFANGGDATLDELQAWPMEMIWK
jgi:sucrose-6-phosphate hydrolase SacC (GH32 family)